MRRVQGKVIDGARLRELRQSLKKTQQKVSEETGISRSAIAKMELEVENASVDDLIALARCYNTTVDYLLGLSTSKSKTTEIKKVCDYVGLDESSVLYLHRITHYGNFANHYKFVLNYLMNKEDFRKIFDLYVQIYTSKYVTKYITDYAVGELKEDIKEKLDNVPINVRTLAKNYYATRKYDLNDYIDGIAHYIDEEEFIELFDFSIPDKPSREDFDAYDDDFSEEVNDQLNNEEYERNLEKYYDELSELQLKYEEFCKKPFEFITNHFGNIDILRYGCLKAIEKVSDEVEKLI